MSISKKYDSAIIIASAVSIPLFVAGGLLNSPLILGMGLLALSPLILLMAIGVVGMIIGLPGEILHQIRRK